VRTKFPADPEMPLGAAIDLAHFQRTCPDEWQPLPAGTSYRACRQGPESWVLVYRLPDGQLEERSVPRWQSDELRARDRRGTFRIVE